MRRLLRSTAIMLALGFFLPAPGPVTGIVFNPAAYADPVTGQIPDWIKASCCGPQDAHKLRADAASEDPDGFWRVSGYPDRINPSQVLPSQDGNVWAFYRDQGGQFSGMYCLFVPMAF